jgi:hypothetical protein
VWTAPPTSVAIVAPSASATPSSVADEAPSTVIWLVPATSVTRALISAAISSCTVGSTTGAGSGASRSCVRTSSDAVGVTGASGQKLIARTAAAASPIPIAGTTQPRRLAAACAFT